MRAVFLEEFRDGPACHEGFRVFTQQPDTHRRAIGLRELPGEQGGQPIPAHGMAHRRPSADAGRCVRFLHVLACSSPPESGKVIDVTEHVRNAPGVRAVASLPTAMGHIELRWISGVDWWRLCAHGAAASNAAAAPTPVFQHAGRPTICKPMGGPSVVHPAGTREIAGCPVT